MIVCLSAGWSYISAEQADANAQLSVKLSLLQIRLKGPNHIDFYCIYEGIEIRFQANNTKDSEVRIHKSRLTEDISTDRNSEFVYENTVDFYLNFCLEADSTLKTTFLLE